MKSVFTLLVFLVLSPFVWAQYNYVQLRNIETNELVDIPLGTPCLLTFYAPVKDRYLIITDALQDTLVFEDSIFIAFHSIMQLAIPNPAYTRGQLIYGLTAVLMVPLSYGSIKADNNLQTFLLVGIVTGLVPAAIITYLSIQGRAAKGGNTILPCERFVIRTLVKNNKNINLNKRKKYFGRD